MSNEVKFVISFSIIAVANFFFNYISDVFDWGIPLDTIGTMAVAMECGYFPGIFVAFLTNIFEMIREPMIAYVMVVNVSIAACTTYFYKKHLFKKIPYIILFIFIAALFSCTFEALLVMDTGAGIEDDFFKFRGEMGVGEAFIATFSYRFFKHIIDKTISFFGAMLLIKITPEKIKERANNYGWMQKPISHEQMKKIARVATAKKSISNRIMGVVVIVCIAITISFMGISHKLFLEIMKDDYGKQSRSYAELVAAEIDGDMVEEYLEKGQKASGYLDVQSTLERIYHSSDKIKYIYVYQVQSDGCHVVFDVETPDTPAQEVGSVVVLDPVLEDQKEILISGKEIDTFEDNCEYGHLITTYAPVYNSKGECVCYGCVDVDLSRVLEQDLNFIYRVLSLGVGFLILIIAWCLWLSKYHLIYPINALVYRANQFDFSDEDARRKNMEKIRDLDIHTGTEIENIYFAFLQVVEESMVNFTYLQIKSEQMNRLQMGLIYVLADLVENRDSSTGDHIRKTAAYVDIILRKMKELGYYEDQLTEIFIEDCIKSAPLHDIGKIQIPDAILNKPGKLTDDEFEIMMTHAKCGADIIQQVIDTLPNSQYLYEAKRIAGSHHEKWDGSGYPEGLSGEEIPLSARIMAVADVFDALISVRVYKKAFSYDDAMNIIEKDAGSHFDPLVADAFLQAADEVKRVSDEFASRYNQLEDED